jgi:hypothetical protein
LSGQSWRRRYNAAPQRNEAVYGSLDSRRFWAAEEAAFIMMELAPDLIIHQAYRAHMAGSQLLQVNTARGQLLFGSDAYSSWEGIRDWMATNIHQTDTVQQFLAYEKCYRITGGYDNCVAAHEPLSSTDMYPLTKNAESARMARGWQNWF